MLKLSKKVEYALISMMHMDSRPNGDLATARGISEDYHIPGELLGKVLQALAKAQLIRSVQGSRGGYQLMRPLEKTTLGEVVQAVEGPVQIAACQGDPACCEQFTKCNIRKPVFRVQQQLLGYMFGLPLSTFRSSPDLKKAAGVP